MSLNLLHVKVFASYILGTTTHAEFLWHLQAAEFLPRSGHQAGEIHTYTPLIFHSSRGDWLQAWLRQGSPGDLGAVVTHRLVKAVARAAALTKKVQGDQ